MHSFDGFSIGFSRGPDLKSDFARRKMSDTGGNVVICDQMLDREPPSLDGAANIVRWWKENSLQLVSGQLPPLKKN